MKLSWRPTRRMWALIWSAVATVALVAVAFLLPVPYVKLAPGPTFNVIGDVDGAPVIVIEGTQTFPTTGQLDMTTVSESGGPRGGLTFVDAIASWFDPNDAVVPRELIYPDDVTGEEVRQRQKALFSTSESDAIAAALTYLNLPVATEVVATSVFENSPADGVLDARDEILAIDGQEITQADQVVQAIRAQPIGTAFTFDIKRGGETLSREVTSADNPQNPGTPYIGITVGNLYTADFDIDFTLQDVGGPSAGLMFATGIIDKLTPEDVTDGRHVAGTGTISPEGEVGSIGGIRQKMAGARDAGAELFFVPRDNCAEAVGFVPDGLTIAAVGSLEEALEALAAWTQGQPTPQCPTDS